MSLTENNNYNGQMTPAAYPGKTLGIVAMVLSLVNFIGIPTSIVGLVMGYFARKESKAAGFENTPARIAIITGWILVIISVVITVLFIAVWISVAMGSQTAEIGESIGGSY